MKPKKRVKGKTIKIYCAKCRTLIYKYRKQGTGHLLKCYKNRIAKDFTQGNPKCPKCQERFARETMIHGSPALKIIQGKVVVRK